MKDTNKNKRKRKHRLKRLARPFLCALLIQIGILTVYICCLLGTRPISREACVSQQIAIEDIQYVRAYGEHCCRVTADGVSYDVANIGTFGAYSAHELYQALDVGDTVSILSMRAHRFFGILPYHRIVEIKDQQTAYLTFEAYASDKARARTGFHILFLCIEVLYIGLCTTYYSACYYKSRPPQKRKNMSEEIEKHPME